MPNMSYCKFENTYNDLVQCYNAIEKADSGTEQHYRQLLIEMCCDIAKEYGDYEFDIDEDDE